MGMVQEAQEPGESLMPPSLPLHLLTLGLSKAR